MSRLQVETFYDEYEEGKMLYTAAQAANRFLRDLEPEQIKRIHYSTVYFPDIRQPFDSILIEYYVGEDELTDEEDDDEQEELEENDEDNEEDDDEQEELEENDESGVIRVNIIKEVGTLAETDKVHARFKEIK